MTIWIARVLRDLEFKVSFPCPVVGDNQSALATASVPETKQSRHINLREHWIRNELWCRGHQWKIETDNKRKRDDEKKQHANPEAKDK
jgi:hypothetical protein